MDARRLPQAIVRLSPRIALGLVLATVLWAPPALARGAQSEPEAVALADAAMKRIAADDVDGAIELLRPHASIEWGEFNVMARRTADAFRARPGGFGEPLGYVYLKHESLGDAVLRVAFLEKFRRKPLQWEFFFYKPEQQWLFWFFRFAGSESLMFNLVSPPAVAPGPSPPAR